MELVFDSIATIKELLRTESNIGEDTTCEKIIVLFFVHFLVICTVCSIFGTINERKEGVCVLVSEDFKVYVKLISSTLFVVLGVLVVLKGVHVSQTLLLLAQSQDGV